MGSDLLIELGDIVATKPDWGRKLTGSAQLRGNANVTRGIKEFRSAIVYNYFCWIATSGAWLSQVSFIFICLAMFMVGIAVIGCMVERGMLVAEGVCVFVRRDSLLFALHLPPSGVSR